MKILYFAKNNQITEAVQYQSEQKQVGNRVVIGNASAKSGFEDSCDKVVLAAKSQPILDWAESIGITVEKLYETVGEAVSDEVVEEKELDSIDAVFSEQVGKASAEDHIVEDTKEFPVPKVSEIEDGDYKDPEGNVYTKKKGPRLKGDFELAIKKFGFDSFTKV